MSVAVALVIGGAVLVAVAAAADRMVVGAAIAAALGGLAAVRIMYSEIVQTRLGHAQERARQSREFGRTVAAGHAEQSGFVASMERRLGFKDRAIGELSGTIRLAEARAEDAESRMRRESRRANEAQARLAELLDEVLADQSRELSDIDAAHDPDLPTIVDLLAWEDRVNESMVSDLRDLQKEA